MNEYAPNLEKEFVTREKVVQAFREKDPGARELLIRWCVERERSVEDNPDGRIKFELEKADIYGEIGFPEDVNITIDCALEVARYEGREDLFAQILSWALWRFPSASLKQSK